MSLEILDANKGNHGISQPHIIPKNAGMCTNISGVLSVITKEEIEAIRNGTLKHTLNMKKYPYPEIIEEGVH